MEVPNDEEQANGTCLGSPDENTGDRKTLSGLIYRIDDTPNFFTLVILVLQNFLMTISGIVGIPLLLAGLVCMRSDIEAYAHLISSTFFIQGLVTFIQSTFGIRLPVVQGASFSFIPAVISLSAAHGECLAVSGNTTVNQSEEWGPRLAEVNGGLFVASLFQIVLGITGLSGWLLRFIGPLSVAPCICLLGLALVDASWPLCKAHWGIAMVTIVCVVMFSQYMKKINCARLRYSRTEADLRPWGNVFQLFPIILAAFIGWTVALILTLCGRLSDDPLDPAYYARTDTGSEFISKARWIQFPTPVATSWPIVTLASVFGMLAGILASIIESLGDYTACAKLSEVAPPPRHAVNRGIFIEGVGCAISGLWGTGTGTGTYSGNIVAIGMTRVASRRVTQGTALLVLIVGFFGKVTAILASIPDPVVGGVLLSLMGLLVSVSFTILTRTDMMSPRNAFIFGLSIGAGQAIPAFLRQYPDAINTGADQLDQVLHILLSTGMFVGGVVGFLLDNTVPGSLEERGIHIRSGDDYLPTSHQLDELSVYDLPFWKDTIRSKWWARWIPICPS